MFLYKTGNENEGRRIVLLEDNKSSSTDIRMAFFNPHTYAPSDDSDRIIRISRNARHQLSLCKKTHYILVDFRLRDSILLIGMLAHFCGCHMDIVPINIIILRRIYFMQTENKKAFK